MNAMSTDASRGILKIAVFAVGGQGGGVLSNWISQLATRGGYAAQMTSVAGVAQRTGATIYYLEMAPESDRQPVFALTPTPGDVDIVIAAELVEAGRAVTRKFVTEDRTTLIASTHRVLAVNEKQVPGDGRAAGSMIHEKIQAAAHQTVSFDMQRMADEAGTMISASLFGALAKSRATPFAAELFEEIIRESGRGVEQSLAAFNAALNYIEPDLSAEQVASSTVRAEKKNYQAVGPEALQTRWASLEKSLENYPAAAQPLLSAGLRKVMDYQDVDYGEEYLQHMQRFSDIAPTDKNTKLISVAAKYIANAMCYDDILRVADLKTRPSRHARLLDEQDTTADQIVHVTEYFHPRAEEFCGTLPAWLGGWIERRQSVFNWFDRRLNKGRRIRTDSVFGFGMLWMVSRLRPFRRKLLRHRYESAHLQSLITLSLDHAKQSPDLACEILKCQRLIKGYSDTHSRSQSKYQRVTSALELISASKDSAGIIQRLREAALEDESGDALTREIEALGLQA